MHESETMPYKTVERPGMLVAGYAIRTTYEDHKADTEIFTAWNYFIDNKIAQKIPHKKSDVLMGVYYEYEKDHTKPFTLLIGCEIESEEGMPEDLKVVHIPDAKYAYVPATGAFPDSLVQAWKDIWKSSIPRTYKIDIEVYGPGFQKDPPTVDLYLSI